jgi:hypothetical protein
VLCYEDGCLSWGPAAALDDGAIAQVEQTSNAGKDRLYLVRLDAQGRLIARSNNLPVKQPHFGGAMAVTAPRQALLAMLDRKEEEFEEDGITCSIDRDQPRWFKCTAAGPALEFKEVDFWKGMAIGGMQAAAGDKVSTWSMIKTSYIRSPEVSATGYLAFGFGATGKPPTLHETTVRCTGVAHVPENERQLLALAVSGYRQATLLRLTAKGEVAEIAPMSPPGQRQGEVAEPAIVRLPDGYLFVWRYYNKRIRKEERDGGLWFRTCDLALTSFDPPRRLAEDREVPAGAWAACRLEDSAVVVWANGASRKKQHVRCVRMRSRADRPKLRELPGPVPDRLVPSGNGVLALRTLFVEKPYEWKLQATRLDSL